MKRLDVNKMIEEGMSLSAIVAAVTHEKQEYEKEKTELKAAEEAKREAERKAAEEESKKKDSVAAARKDLVDAFMAYFDALDCPVDDFVQKILEEAITEMEPKAEKLSGFKVDVKCEDGESGIPFCLKAKLKSKEDADDFVEMARKFLAW